MKIPKSLIVSFCAVSIVLGSPFGDEKASELFSPVSDFTFSLFSGTTTHRLPNNSIPLRYDLTLKTDIDKKNFDFSGRVKILIKVIEPSKRITLHVNELEIDKIDLLKSDNTLTKSDLKFKKVKNYNFLHVTLPKKMSENEKIVLDIQYHGKIEDKSKGFTYSRYDKAENEQGYMAVSRFEPIHARKAFPCFDEPQIRAIINLRIQHNKDFHAISSMPIVKRQIVSGSDYVLSEFEDTPVIPTYLLAFVISDLKFISNNDTRIEQRIYARTQSIDKGEANYAVNAVGPYVRKLENFFGIDFPLEKFDHIAHNNYINKMAQFGMGIYYDGDLLSREGWNWNTKEDIMKGVAGRLTENYLSNLISTSWSDLWINKGLSYFYSYYFTLNQVIPPFGYFNMDYDKQPISSYAESPNQISKKFDEIEFKRAGAIFQMFSKIMTPETFSKGIKYYLNAMKFKTATPNDLYRELQKAFDEDFPGNGINLKGNIQTWVDQTGYPIISVEKSGNKFILKQENLDGGSQIYSIPVFYTTKTNPKFDEKASKVWMTTRVLEIETEDDWIILNVDFSGFYKVKYGRETTINLINTLQNNHNVIPARHRLAFFNEFSELIVENSLPTSAAFKMFDYMKHETDYSVWIKFNQLESFFRKHLFGTTVYQKYEQFMQSLIKPHLEKYGLNEVKGELKKVKNFRHFFTSLGCKYNQPECLDFQIEKLRKEHEIPFFDMCCAMKIADEELFVEMLHKFNDANSIKYEEIVNDGFFWCTLDKNLLKKFFTAAMNHTDTILLSYPMKLAMTTSIEGLEASFEFTIDNFDAIKTKIGRPILYMFSVNLMVNTEKHIEQLKTILKLLENNFIEPDTYKRIYEHIEENEKWIADNFGDVEKWLDEEILKMTTITI